MKADERVGDVVTRRLRLKMSLVAAFWIDWKRWM